MEDKAVTIQAFHRPIRFQEVEAPRFLDSWHMKVIRLSAVCASCLYRQEMILVIISVRGRVNPRVLVWLEGLYRWKFPMAPLGIIPETWLVEQCLNQLCHLVPLTNSLTLKVKKQETCINYCLLKQMSVKWGMGVLQCINTYAAESDHTPAVCVVGHWVARIFSMTYYTHHRWGCVYVCLR